MVMKVVTFKLPAEYVDALGAKAAASEVSVSQLLRNVVAAEVGLDRVRSRRPIKQAPRWPAVERRTVLRHQEIQQLLIAIAGSLVQCRTTGDADHLPVIHCLLSIVYYQAEHLIDLLGGGREC